MTKCRLWFIDVLAFLLKKGQGMPLTNEKGTGVGHGHPNPTPRNTSYVTGLRSPTTIQPAEKAISTTYIIYLYIHHLYSPPLQGIVVYYLGFTYKEAATPSGDGDTLICTVKKIKRIPVSVPLRQLVKFVLGSYKFKFNSLVLFISASQLT